MADGSLAGGSRWRSESLPRWFAAVGVVLFAVGCVPAMRPFVPVDGHCSQLPLDATDLRVAQARALASLVIVPYTSHTTYDVNGASHTLQGHRQGMSAAVVGFPQFSGVPRWDKAFVEHGRSFVYDNALAAIAFGAVGRQSMAELFLDTLVALQRDDGAWGFSFAAREDNFYNRNYVRAGAVAWAGYALAVGATQTKRAEYAEAALSAGRYLLAARMEPSSADERAGLILGGLGRWSADDSVFYPDERPEVAVTEHQVDTWFLFDALSDIDPTGPWARAREDLARAVERAAWRAEIGLFAAGVGPQGPIEEWALDAAGVWSALWLGARGRTDAAIRVLANIGARFDTQDGPISGLRPYAGAVSDYAGLQWDSLPLVFVEGTLGGVLAEQRYGEPLRADRLLEGMLRLQCAMDGALPYASRREQHFPTVAAAAPSLWLALVIQDRLSRGAPWSVWPPAPR